MKSLNIIDWLDQKVLSWLLATTRTHDGPIRTTTYVFIGLLGALFISVKFGWTVATLWWSRKRKTATSHRTTSRSQAPVPTTKE